MLTMLIVVTKLIVVMVVVQVFYTMAMAGLWEVTGEEEWRVEGLTMMDRVVAWALEGLGDLGRPTLSGSTPSSSLAVPMCVLCLLPLVEPLVATPDS